MSHKGPLRDWVDRGSTLIVKQAGYQRCKGCLTQGINVRMSFVPNFPESQVPMARAYCHPFHMQSQHHLSSHLSKDLDKPLEY
jgi:hypothetical protein